MGENDLQDKSGAKNIVLSKAHNSESRVGNLLHRTIRGVFSLSFVSRLYRCLRKYFPDLIVTIVGVWLAFWLTGLGEQKSLDKATKQRLYLVELEIDYNVQIANELYARYSKDAGDTIPINLKRPVSDGVLIALGDTNIFSLLSVEKVDCLKEYINAIRTLSQFLDTHLDVLKSQDFKATVQERELRIGVRQKIVDVFAIAKVLREDLRVDVGERPYDSKRIKTMQERIDNARESVLKSMGESANQGESGSSI